jgi:uncharacterized protein (DUF58 family)
MEELESPQRVWQVSTPVRKAAVVVALAFVVVALVFTTVGTVAGATAIWLLCVVVLLSVWRWYLVPYVALTADSLVVQGVFARRSVRYCAITDARPGFYGLKIETTNQGAFSVWAVQKSKFAEWTHKHTVADEVVAEIKERMQVTSA